MVNWLRDDGWHDQASTLVWELNAAENAERHVIDTISDEICLHAARTVQGVAVKLLVLVEPLDTQSFDGLPHDLRITVSALHDCEAMAGRIED